MQALIQALNEYEYSYMIVGGTDGKELIANCPFKILMGFIANSGEAANLSIKTFGDCFLVREVI